MNVRKLFVVASIVSFVALPAMAQTAPSVSDKSGGHHYSGGPKTESHHMGKKESAGSKSKSSGGSHHYSGGPKTEVPHHIGPKKDQ